MSFFERMMKINQPNSKNSLKEIQSIYHEEQTAPNREEQFIHNNLARPITKHSSMRSSIAIKFQQEEQEKGWEQLINEPKIQPVYISQTPAFLSHLLPKREQLMREMLVKKQLQLKRKMLCQQKKLQLETKIEQDSLKFKNSLIKLPKKSSCKQSVTINQLGESQVSEKLNKSQLRKQSLKNTSGSKKKKFLALGQSTYSINANVQGLGSPVSEAFNRQIMLKLLNIIEKDRQNVCSKPNMMVSEKKQKQREAPIIINNILKTPHQNINKDLIDRQLKIKILENNRLERQKGSIIKPKQPAFCKSAVRAESENEERVLTERINLGHKIQTPEFQVLIQDQCYKSRCKHQISLQKIDVESNENTKMLKIDKKKIQQLMQSKKGLEQISMKIFDDSSTKFNSQDSNLKNQELNSQKKSFKSNKRQFSNVRIQKQEQNSNKPKNIRQVKGNQKEIKFEKQVQEEYKPPVRIDIPLQNKSQMQGLTLAQAFKRKIGRLKSQQKQEKTSKNKQKIVKNVSSIQELPSQMNVTLTDKLTQYHSRFDLERSQTINLHSEDLPSKRTVTSKHFSRQTSVRKESVEDRSNSKVKEPSVQLVNRLIYGTKAKVSKQQMYALTRKNYANLPEVQAKKKEQQKRKAQQERLAKAKQYQKAIRGGKASTKI